MMTSTKLGNTLTRSTKEPEACFDYQCYKIEPMPNNSKENLLAEPSLRTISQEIGRYFSPTFEHTRVVALSVDPFTIHVYWHISREDRVAELFQADAQISLVLRFQHLSNENKLVEMVTDETFEIPVKATDNNCYVQLQQDGQCYIVELGIKSQADSSFTSLARSNPSTTPFASSSREDQAVIFIDHRHTDYTPAQQVIPPAIAQSLYQRQATETPQQTALSNPGWSGVFSNLNEA